MEPIPGSVSEKYSYGGCIWMALALHDRYGWPIYAQIEDDGTPDQYVAHAYVRHPNGTEVDVLGPQSSVDQFASTVRRMSRNDFVGFVADTNRTDPSDIERRYRSERHDAETVIDRYIEPRLVDAGLIAGTSIARVAARWVAASEPLLKGSAYLRMFTSARDEVTRLLREGDVDGAVDAFDGLAAGLRPVWEAASKVVVQRADEQRRLRSFMDKVAPLRYMTAPGYIRRQVASGMDAWAMLTVSLDTLEETVGYLSRNVDRLVGYGEIEREFAHGPFRIRNPYGFRPDEYQAPLAVLDAAADAIRTAGFGSVLYGDVILTGAKGAGFAGRYHMANDTVELNVDSRFRHDATYTMVHEFGHRHWFRVLSDSAREAYTDAYHGTADGLTVADREAILDALVRADFSAARAARLLPDRLAAVVVQYVRERAGAETQRALRNQWGLRPDEVRVRLVLPRTRVYYLDGVRPQSVTDYGRTNEREDYAEVFAHVVLGKTVAGRAYDRFVAAVGGAS